MPLTESEKTEIFRRLEESEKRDYNAIYQRLKNGNGSGNILQASWVRQSIGLTIAIISLIGFLVPTIVAIIRPIQQQIDYIRENTTYIESRAEKLADVVNEKLHIEIEAAIKATNLEHERAKARLDKLEEWQKWWYRDFNVQ